jgi:hypothetical protein
MSKISGPEPERKRDVHIQRRLAYLTAEHARLRGGAVGLHYLHCGHRHHAEFSATGDPRSRFAAWLAIRTASSWLAQLERREAQ